MEYRLNKEKDLMQKNALKAWKENKYRGTVIAGTGAGKTRLGVLAIKELVDNNLIQNALIVVPTSNLRDNEWVNEISRWAEDILPIVTIECIQTARKFTEDDVFDVLIMDEVHTSLSDKHRAVYENVKWKYLLGLTATEPENKEYKDYLYSIAPAVFTFPLEDAVKKGLVAEYEIFNIPTKFNRAERAKYNAYSKMFTHSTYALSQYGKSAFDTATEIIKSNNTSHPGYKDASKFWLGITKRRSLCYKAEKKIDVCLDIIRRYPYRKWIVFSHNIEWAEELQEKLLDDGILAICYHSKKSSSDRETILNFAKSPLVQVIVSVQALTTGYNLPAIDAAICAASTSKSLTMIQSLGRILRKDYTGKVGLFINLYVPDTQEEKWLLGKSKSLKTKFITNVDKLLKQCPT